MIVNSIGYGLYYLFFDMWQNTILCSWANEKYAELETVRELNDDIEALENNMEFYEGEIKKDKTFIEKMKDSNEIEKFAREKYFLKKENEDIFIIEHQDSLKNSRENE